MKCPICINTDLIMSERQGIEIDYCPSCRGIWLDRGELDKIIEKSIVAESGIGSPITHQQFKGKKHQDYDDYYKKRKRHWLDELFD
jgi:uncharacterized protein